MNVALRYLKEESHYNDLYDLSTIEECLRIVESFRNAWKKQSNDENLKNLSAKKKSKHFSFLLNWKLFFVKGERFKNRSSTIREWIDRDRSFDTKLENIKEPGDNECQHCYKRMKIVFKGLYDFSLDSPRILFFFECSACHKRKGIFENGEEFISASRCCPRCNKDIKVSYTREGNVITSTRNCPSCGFTETEIDDLDKHESDRRKQQARERDLLQKYRVEFCLSPEEGQEYFASIARMDSLKELLKETVQKRTDPGQQEISKLKKLSVAQLEKLISKIIEKQNYIRLMLEKPAIDRYVIVPFTVQDADESRKENESVRGLQKIIKKTLDGTNWRLMSDGLHYKLGYLSGRLKGYELEEDLLQLVKSPSEN